MKQNGVEHSSMQKRVYALIIILLVFPTMALQEETVQFESPISDQTSSLNVEIASDVYSSKDRQILCCPKSNYLVVRNRIYLGGADLNKIKEVKYFLHETFDQPEGVIGDPANNFEIWIWTWGGFQIKAVITTKTGQVFEKYFDFSFKSKFEEARNKGIPQILRCYE